MSPITTGTPAGRRIETPRYRFFDTAMPDGNWRKFAEFTSEETGYCFERELNAVELAAASLLRQHVCRDKRLAAAQDIMHALELENDRPTTSILTSP